MSVEQRDEALPDGARRAENRHGNPGIALGRHVSSSPNERARRVRRALVCLVIVEVPSIYRTPHRPPCGVVVVTVMRFREQAEAFIEARRLGESRPDCQEREGNGR